jgi:hypothetical protein
MFNKICTINTQTHTIKLGDCLTVIVGGEVRNYIVEEGVEYEIDCDCEHLFRKHHKQAITYYNSCQNTCPTTEEQE